MKPIWTTMMLLLTVTTLTPACKKDNDDDKIVCPAYGNRAAATIANLLGSWQLTATKISPGTLVTEWTTVDYYETISWPDANTFITKDRAEKGFQLTTLPGDTLALMKYYTRGETDTVTVYVAVFDDGVVISGQCIEGCSWKYARTYDKYN